MDEFWSFIPAEDYLSPDSSLTLWVHLWIPYTDHGHTPNPSPLCLSFSPSHGLARPHQLTNLNVDELSVLGKKAETSVWWLSPSTNIGKGTPQLGQCHVLGYQIKGSVKQNWYLTNTLTRKVGRENHYHLNCKNTVPGKEHLFKKIKGFFLWTPTFLLLSLPPPRPPSPSPSSSFDLLLDKFKVFDMFRECIANRPNLILDITKIMGLINRIIREST